MSSRGVADPGAPAERLFTQYAEEARGLIAQGAAVVVMPEDLAVIVDPNTAAADGILQKVADETGGVLVIGMNHVSGAVRHNEARIYAPGVAVRSYDKEHLLPPFENMFTPGTSRTVLRGMGRNAEQRGAWRSARISTSPSRRGAMGGRGWACCSLRRGISRWMRSGMGTLR